LILPVTDIFLRRLMILNPVVAAGVKVVQLVRGDRPVPTHAEDIRPLGQVVVVRIQAGQRSGAIGAGRLMLAIMAPIAGNPMLFVENMVALEAIFIYRIYLRSRSYQVVIRNVGRRTRRRAVIRSDRSAALENTQRLDRRWAPKVLGDHIPWK